METHFKTKNGIFKQLLVEAKVTNVSSLKFIEKHLNIALQY